MATRETQPRSLKTARELEAQSTQVSMLTIEVPLTLREARVKFTQHLGALIEFAISQGFEIAVDEATERLTTKDPTSDHITNSLHHIGLAADLLLYDKGVYLTATSKYALLG